MEIRGTGKLIGALKKRTNLNDVKKTVILNASEMQRKAQRYAPVDTGNLKRNINMYQKDGGFTGEVRSEAEYAPYQEYGTRFQPGKAHIRPAFHEQKTKYINDLKRLMK